jgi:intracellular multiplication protein IcmL
MAEISKSATAKVSKAVKTSKNDSLVSVIKRNRELDRRTQRVMMSFLLLCAALIISVCGNVFLALRSPAPLYFAQDIQTGTLTPLLPLDKPIQNRGVIVQHVADTLQAINSIDFRNYRSQLDVAGRNFTAEGWKRYLAEFESTGTLEAMQKRQLVLSGVVSEPPVITGEGDIFGIHYWDVQAPFRVTWAGAGSNQTLSYVALAKIVRVPQTENPKGIAVGQLVVRAGGG